MALVVFTSIVLLKYVMTVEVARPPLPTSVGNIVVFINIVALLFIAFDFRIEVPIAFGNFSHNAFKPPISLNPT